MCFPRHAFYRPVSPHLVGPCLRHEVPEPDGGQGNEAEVGRVQEAPVLPLGEEEGAAEDVADDQDAADPQRDL